MPAGVIRVALSELDGGGAQMDITTAWANDEAMEPDERRGGSVTDTTADDGHHDVPSRG